MSGAWIPEPTGEHRRSVGAAPGETGTLLASPDKPSTEDELGVYVSPDGEWRAPDGWNFRRGGDFILDTPVDPEPLWGAGSDVLLADGEALIIAGGQGLGKTTLAQQLALGMAGFEEYAELLGWPVADHFKVLYLAMDRPRQVARSFRRMVGEAWREQLNDRIVVWQGPPQADMAKFPSMLTVMCGEVNATAVVVDSLKDAAIGLSDDEVGASWNRGRQKALSAGIQVVELHHNRKAVSGAKAARAGIDDLYGSTWLTSGAGSVLLLTGAPGDPIVGLHHLKQPATEVGPLKVIHDHTTGRSTVWHSTDLVQLVSSPGGLSAVDAARVLFETEKPTASQREKARRRLDRLVSTDAVRVVAEGDRTTNQPTKWGPA